MGKLTLLDDSNKSAMSLKLKSSMEVAEIVNFPICNETNSRIDQCCELWLCVVAAPVARTLPGE